MKTHFPGSGQSQGVADLDITSNAKNNNELDIPDSEDEIIPPTPLAKQNKMSKVIIAELILLKNRFVLLFFMKFLIL